MKFSSALIPFLSSLSTTAMAMEEPHDSVLHNVAESILEESIEVKYKSKKSRLEPMKIQNSIDGHPNKANDVKLADDKGDIMQKKEMIHHLVDHQEHQEEKSLEECNTSPTSTTTTAAAAAAATAAATATSDDDSLMKRRISLNKESITKMDYGHLNRGTCSSPNDACVPQNKAIEGNGAFLEPEDASYASSGYCVPLSFLEGIEYKNVVTTTMSRIDNEEFNKEEEMSDSYYHYHPQYDEHHRQLDSLDCTSLCPGTRPDVSSYERSFRSLTTCYINGDCTLDYPDISCWNTAGITDMRSAFDSYYGYYRQVYPSNDDDINGYGKKTFNDPLECWDVGQVTTMRQMFSEALKFNQSIDSWNVSKVKDMDDMFRFAYDFNQSLDSWDVSQVETMRSMFGGASSFNQPVDSWNVSQVETMRSMFGGASSFNQPVDSWDVSQVETMRSMFSGAISFNQPIDSWDVSQVKDMYGMFRRAGFFNQPIDSWNVSQVEDMERLFYRAYSFNQPIDSWNVSKVEDMFGMLYGVFSFNQCLSTWAEKTSDTVRTRFMLKDTDCPNGIESPDATIGPWCQDNTQGCFAPGFGTPTGAPTGTKNPNECNNVDESDFSFKGKSCKKYLKKKTEKKCKNRIDGVLVADSCPSLCKRFCPPCKDKSGKIKLENGKSFNCKKIKKKKKCNSITKSGASAKEICPVACKFEGC